MSKRANTIKIKTITNVYGTCTVEITMGKNKAIAYKPQEGWKMFPMDISTIEAAHKAKSLKNLDPDFISCPKVGRDHQVSYMIPMPEEECRILTNLYTTPKKAEEREEEKITKVSLEGMNPEDYQYAVNIGDVTHDTVMAKIDEEEFWKFLRKSARNGKKLVTMRKMNQYGFSVKDIASALGYKRENSVYDNLTKIAKLHIKYESQYED